MNPVRALAVGGGVLLLAGVALVGWALVGTPRANGPAPMVVIGSGPARAPFTGLTEADVVVGDRTLRVVIADDLDERVEGLRGQVDAAPYGGMLFVFPGDATTGFTMAGVPGPLDLAFFDGTGRRLGDLTMATCADADATCPGYFAPRPYRFALETAAGAMPPGDLRLVAR